MDDFVEFLAPRSGSGRGCRSENKDLNEPNVASLDVQTWETGSTINFEDDDDEEDEDEDDEGWDEVDGDDLIEFDPVNHYFIFHFSIY